jgi:hypothetical protein
MVGLGRRHGENLARFEPLFALNAAFFSRCRWRVDLVLLLPSRVAGPEGCRLAAWGLVAWFNIGGLALLFLSCQVLRSVDVGRPQSSRRRVPDSLSMVLKDCHSAPKPRFWRVSGEARQQTAHVASRDACCEAPLPADTMAHVKITNFMVLTVTGNVKMVYDWKTRR